MRASALRLPMRLAALLASVGCLRFMQQNIKPSVRILSKGKSPSPKVHHYGSRSLFLNGLFAATLGESNASAVQQLGCEG